MTGKGAIEVPQTVAAWRAWLGGTVLPYWRKTVAAELASYVEYLTPEGKLDRRREKTPLVTARMIYAFSHAHALGLDDESLAAAEHGFRFLTERCWDARDGGFFHVVTADGVPLDRRKDAYDHAFALLAMAWLHRASGKQEPLDWAKRIIDCMDSTLADSAGGYREHGGAREAQPLPRRQNPHMHLLEAFHALYEAGGDGAWLNRASAMVELLSRRFFDEETGSLGEFFNADWSPAAGLAGRLREPGHHFEWVWLLHHHARLTGERSALGPAERLYRFALAHGLEREPSLVPAAFDEVDRDGTIISGTKLMWPQTEAIKAFLARFEFCGDGNAAARLHHHLAMLFRWYLVDDTARWRNRLSRDGREISTELPVRVFYHLFMCFAEALRLWPMLTPPVGPSP